MGRHHRRAYPDLNQGPADLQSAALSTELYTHVDRCKMLGYSNQRVVSSWFFELRAQQLHGPVVRPWSGLLALGVAKMKSDIRT